MSGGAGGLVGLKSLRLEEVEVSEPGKCLASTWPATSMGQLHELLLDEYWLLWDLDVETGAVRCCYQAFLSPGCGVCFVGGDGDDGAELGGVSKVDRPGLSVIGELTPNEELPALRSGE